MSNNKMFSDMQADNTELLQGNVERITFHSEDSGFCVLKISVPKMKDLGFCRVY